MKKSNKLALIFVHGVGNETFNRKGWSKIIQKRLGKKHFAHYECIWNSVTQVDHRQAFEDRFKRPRFYKLISLLTFYLRKFIFDYVVDATAYNEYRDAILADLDVVYKEASENHERVILVGYSLGGWISYDYIANNSTDSLCGLITLGSSIPFHRVENFEGLKGGRPWLNVWEENDVLSMPFAKEGIQDVSYSSRTPIIGMSPLAHVDYMLESKVSDIMEKFLLRNFIK